MRLNAEAVPGTYTVRASKLWSDFVPDPENGGYAIEVTFASPFEQRHANFRRSARVAAEPDIGVDSPRGGEYWEAGTTHYLVWSSIQVPSNVAIELSRDGGATYTLLVPDTANDGQELWTSTGPATSQARIRVRALDGAAAGQSGFDFAIIDTLPPTITAPPDVTVELGESVTLGLPTVIDLGDPNPTVANDAPAAFPVGETTVTWTATDASGNQATATQKVTVLWVDRVAPQITVSSPEAKRYLLNASVAAAYSATDEGSGVASCTGTVPVGAALDTATPGRHTFQVTATDHAGNTSTTTVNYTVGFSVRAMYDQTKTHKSGSTVPIKVRVEDANGVNLSSSSLTVTAVQVCWVDGAAGYDPEDSGNANPDGNFRYADGQYVFNLSTKGLSTGTWELRLKVVGDPAPHAVTFKIR